MSRSQLSIIAAAVTGGALITAISLSAVRTGKNDIAFRSAVTLEVEGVTTVHTVADDAGKVRRFGDADDFLKQAGALGLMSDTIAASVVIDGLELVAPKPFTGDIVKKNQSIVAAYVKRKAIVLERVTGLTAQIALAGTTPGVPASVVTELTAQKASVVALADWLDDEITRINAILEA